MGEETGEIGTGFSVNVCKQWEEMAKKYTTPATRQVILRIAMVLGKEGGVFPVLSNLIKYGLGGKQGNGNQYVSWVHEDDFIQIINHIIEHTEISGAVNCCAPQPIPNKEFMQSLRKKLSIPFGIPAYKWMLEIGAFFLRTETELILKSRRVVPTRLIESGYKFKYPNTESAINQLLTC